MRKLTHRADREHVGNSPRLVGSLPRREFLLRTLGGAAVVAAGPLGCGAAPDSRTWGPYVIAITNTTPPVAQGEEDAVFMVRRPITIPVKPRPDGLAATPGYRRPVWITPDKLRTQLSYVITNLESTDLRIEFLVDGWNGSVYYSPQTRVVDDAVVSDRSCIQRLMILPAKSRVQGRISYDDFERMAIALAGMSNTALKAPNPFHFLDPSVKLYESPLSKPYIPQTIESILGFDVSLRLTAGVGTGAPRVAVEATVEALDLDEVLMASGEEEQSPNTRRDSYGRAAFVPVVAEEAT